MLMPQFLLVSSGFRNQLPRLVSGMATAGYQLARADYRLRTFVIAAQLTPSNNQIDGLTQFGTGEGFSIGDSIEAASDELTGVYFIISTAGDQINVANVNGTAFDAGDWIICNGAANGWVRIDTASGGGGGGGGASTLNELLDVNIPTASDGALLQLQPGGQWQDVYAIDAGEY